MNIKDFNRNKILGKTGGLVKEPSAEENRLTFINDSDRIIKQRIKEYDVWYYGDGDELLNFYTYENTVEYNYEWFYNRNKKDYFWAISSTENGIKRTHSGQARNVVDTLVSICPFPVISIGSSIKQEQPEPGQSPASMAQAIFNKSANETLQLILKNCRLKSIYKNQQMPMTLVEGWGCYKINWDKDVSPYPFPVYYRASNVDFILNSSNRIIGCIFKDYYTDGNNRRYMLAETRSLKYDPVTDTRNLIIEKQIFTTAKDTEDYVVEANFSDVPELKDTQSYIEIGPIDFLFAVPSIIFESNQSASGYGRSIYCGKLDLFDDLDQCLSQAANTVRRSTAVEYFNSDFLERDTQTGLPKQPKAYDRKYSVYQGQKDGMGASMSANPVQVTQPMLNFDQYSSQAINIMLQIINGIMSPATLGIDIAKKDNADAQREKEKMTIFTRNNIIDTEEDILRDLCIQLMAAYEFMTTGKITVKDYDVSIKFSEFANESFENKLAALGGAYSNQLISDEMYISKLYGDSLSDEEKQKELKWLQEIHNAKMQGMAGIAGGGQNIPGMDTVDPEEQAAMENGSMGVFE